MNFCNESHEEKLSILEAIKFHSKEIAETVKSNIGTNYVTAFYPNSGTISSLPAGRDCIFNTFYFGHLQRLRESDITEELVVDYAQDDLFSEAPELTNPVDAILRRRYA